MAGLACYMQEPFNLQLIPLPQKYSGGTTTVLVPIAPWRPLLDTPPSISNSASNPDDAHNAPNDPDDWIQIFGVDMSYFAGTKGLGQLCEGPEGTCDGIGM